MVLPLLVVVTAALAWVLGVGADQLRIVDATREVARALARGDDQSAAVALGRRVAPEGTRFSVREEGGLVIVEGRAQAIDGAIGARLLPDVTLTAEAVALAESDP
jgi:hypothetical protein